MQKRREKSQTIFVHFHSCAQCGEEGALAKWKQILLLPVSKTQRRREKYGGHNPSEKRPEFPGLKARVVYDRGIHPMPMTIEFVKNVVAQCKKLR